MFDIISTKEVTYLKDLDKRININKYGKFYYYKIYDLNNSQIWNFLNELDENKVYTLIPSNSANNRSDEPYIIISPQILITNNSNSLLLSNYINNKIIDTINLYHINNLENITLIFKYKSIKIKFNEYNKFI
jgi:hypothetical protein